MVSQEHWSSGQQEELIHPDPTVVVLEFISSYGNATPGQIAQALADWHAELKLKCSAVFQALISEGSNKQEANAHPNLAALQTLKRSVRVAMLSYARAAHGQKVSILPRYDRVRDID